MESDNAICLFISHNASVTSSTHNICTSPAPLLHSLLPPRPLLILRSRDARNPLIPSGVDRDTFHRTTVYILSRSVVSGQWSVVSGQWSVVSGQWSVVSGQWSVVSGQWSVVSGQWSAVSGQRSVVSGQWSVVSGQWSVVSGQWSVVSGHYSARC